MDTLLNVLGVAQKLNISRSGVYRLLDEPDFPKPFHVGKSTRFDPADIDKYIQRQKQKALGSSTPREG